MADALLGAVLQQVGALAGGRAAQTDRQLLEAFVLRGDEAAFGALLHRHGPMVLGVCRRLLRHQQDAEDAFQATVLILAQKAASIRNREAVGSWLWGVARRTALKVKRSAARARAVESRVTPAPPPGAELQLAARELQAALDEVLAAVPEKYRAPLLLCYFEGRTVEEAGRELGCPRGTVASRLARGRELLRRRLARRGLTLTAAALTSFLLSGTTPAAVPPPLVASTFRAGLDLARGKTAPAVTSAAVARLITGGFKGASLACLKIVAVLLLGGLVVGAVVATREAAPAAAPGSRPEPKQQAAEVRRDRRGDPLPAGALARLGTARFRHTDMVSNAVLCRDGKTLITGDRSGHLIFWDVVTGKQSRRLWASRLIASLAVSPDGKTLAVAGYQNVRLWDLATGNRLRDWKTPSLRCLVFSPDGKTLAGSPYDSPIYLWDPATGAKRHELKGHRGWVNALAFSPDGKQLASCSGENNLVRLWDVAAGRQVRQLKGEGRQVVAVAWSPDGKTVAGGGNNTLYLWDSATGRERARTALPYTGTPSQIAYLPDGSALLGLHSNIQTIRLYDPATGKILRSFAPALRAFAEMAISPDGKRVVASGGGPHTVELWDVASGKLLDSEGHRQPVTCLAFARGAKVLYSGSGTTEYGLRVWDPATGKELRRLERRDGTLGSDALAVSPGGTLLAVATYDGRDFEGVSLRDRATAREVRRLKDPGRIVSVGFSADGKRLASCSWDQDKKSGSIRLWDVATGKAGVLIRTGQEWPSPAALSPDGKLVAAGGYQDGTVRVWDADTGKRVRRIEVSAGMFALQPFTVYPLAFAPDGRLLAVGGWRGTIGLWDVTTGKLVRRLDDPSNRVAALAFSPDGRTLVTGGEGVRLWEVATGQLRARRTGHAGEVSSLAFSDEGRLLASGSTDTTILTWDLSAPAAETARLKPEALWDGLAGDAAEAYRAVGALAAQPKQAVPLLRQRLRPVPLLTAAGRERFARLLAELGSDRFAVRERAASELAKQGDTVELLLRQALARKPTLEVRRRLEKLLGDLAPESPKRLRLVRAVEALEHAGGAEARRLLEELAGGAPGAWLTREARASLDRLRRHQ
jgi:RNA polymerase sigma factor (sigma-70 family)